MTALYIIGAIILFFFLVGLIRVEAVIYYSDEFALTVRVLGIPIRIIPARPRTVRIRDYSPKALEKRRRKEEKKAKKKALKDAKKQKKKDKKDAEKKAKAEKAKSGAKTQEKKTDIAKIISLVTKAVAAFIRRFGKSLRIRVAKLHVGVAAGDAAKTAILYGTVVQAVCYLANMLDATSTLKNPVKSDVQIYADYLSEKPVLDIEIGFSLCIWQLFSMAFGAVGAALRELMKK